MNGTACARAGRKFSMCDECSSFILVNGAVHDGLQVKVPFTFVGATGATASWATVGYCAGQLPRVFVDERAVPQSRL